MTKFFESGLGMITLFVLGALAFYLVSAISSGNWNQFASNKSNVSSLNGINNK